MLEKELILNYPEKQDNYPEQDILIFSLLYIHSDFAA